MRKRKKIKCALCNRIAIRLDLRDEEEADLIEFVHEGDGRYFFACARKRCMRRYSLSI